MCQRHIVKWEKQGVSVDPQSVNPQSRPPELFNKDILSKGNNQDVSKHIVKMKKSGCVKDILEKGQIRVCERHAVHKKNLGVSVDSQV